MSTNAGLANHGNTCYFNSILQCLYGSRHFRQYITSALKQNGDQQSLMKAIKSIFDDMDINVVGKPKQLLDILQRTLPSYLCVYEQNDAMEFFTILIDKLNTEVGYPIMKGNDESHNNHPMLQLQEKMSENWTQTHQKSFSQFTNIMYGQNIVQLHCAFCGKNEHRGEVFCAIDVPVTDNLTELDLLSRIQLAYKCEAVVRDCEYCSKASGEKRPGKRSVRLWRLPKVLVIHLKRFNDLCEKINADVQIPEMLDLAVICIGEQNTSYKLRSVICHSGSFRYGHYFTVLRDGKNWVVYDDDMKPQIVQTDIQAIKNLSYILFYDLVDL